MSKNMAVLEAELRTLRKYEFYAKGTQIAPFRFKTIHIEKYLSDEAWAKRKARQLAKYYRQPGAIATVHPTTQGSREFPQSL